MPTEKKKDPRRQLIGSINKARGRFFESELDAAFEHYRKTGAAHIEKTPEPFHMIGQAPGGKVTGFYSKKAQPDYQGTLKGGRSVLLEAKYTTSDRLEQARVNEDQAAYLSSHAALGAHCYVIAGFGTNNAYCVPWDVWANMKTLFGRKYVTEKDLTPYKIARTTTGGLAILG